MTTAADLPELLLRLSRLAEAEGWDRSLNPAQAAALAYLARANRFSRAPSHLADWLGATRGTVSQTLKSLAARGLVAEGPSPRDRRSISYSLTGAGEAALNGSGGLAAALAALPPAQADQTAMTLAALLREMLARRGLRPFGLCRTCRHHRPAQGQVPAFCSLLSVALEAPDTGQICAEFAA